MPYGTAGLASYAISAVDIALWSPMPVIRDGRVRPSDAPGLGLEIDAAWLESRII